MKIKTITFAALIMLTVLMPIAADAQRRGRPGSMRHTEAEAQQATKKTVVKAKYIHDGVTFKGQLLMVGEAGALKMGDVSIAFSGGKYRFIFDSADLKMKKLRSSTRDERIKEGISEYEYNNSYEYKQMMEDIDYRGKYAVVEQYGKYTLYLYDGDNTDRTFMKAELSGADATSFVCEEGIYTFDMKLSN